MYLLHVDLIQLVEDSLVKTHGCRRSLTQHSRECFEGAAEMLDANELFFL